MSRGMTPTAKQMQALKITVDRFFTGQSYTCIAGYAGTGKTSLVQLIILSLDLDPAVVAFTAYTGKAAKVLERKGCPNATTLHKLLYKAVMKADGSYSFIPKSSKEIQRYGIIVVDEVSMVPKPMWDLLVSYGVYVIACGDPG